MKLKKLIVLLLVVTLVMSSTVMANAESWGVAEELGFDVPRTKYDSFCWINERSTTAKYQGNIAGIAYYQTCACRDKSDYLNKYSKFTQMSRVISEPSTVKVTYTYFLWFKRTSPLMFQTDYVEMYDGLVSGQTICDYFATSPSLDKTTVVNNGWNVGADKSFSVKGIEFGGSAEGSVSYSSTEGVATSYNSTKKKQYFKVKFQFKDLEHEISTREQKNLAYNQCTFNTGVSFYGTKEVMKKFNHTGSYKVCFSGYYTLVMPFSTSLERARGSATASESTTFVYYTY